MNMFYRLYQPQEIFAPAIQKYIPIQKIVKNPTKTNNFIRYIISVFDFYRSLVVLQRMCKTGHSKDIM